MRANSELHKHCIYRSLPRMFRMDRCNSLNLLENESQLLVFRVHGLCPKVTRISCNFLRLSVDYRRDLLQNRNQNRYAATLIDSRKSPSVRASGVHDLSTLLSRVSARIEARRAAWRFSADRSPFHICALSVVVGVGVGVGGSDATKSLLGNLLVLPCIPLVWPFVGWLSSFLHRPYQPRLPPMRRTGQTFRVRPFPTACIMHGECWLAGWLAG